MKAWKSDSVTAGRMSQVKSPRKTKSLTVNANEVYKCNPLIGMMNVPVMTTVTLNYMLLTVYHDEKSNVFNLILRTAFQM